MSLSQTPSPARTVYVYFKARFDQASAVAQAAQLQLAHIAAEHSLSGHLQKRAELVAVDGLQTWMEIYTNVPTGFDLQQFAQAQQALSRLIEGTRQVEVFVDVN